VGRGHRPSPDLTSSGKGDTPSPHPTPSAPMAPRLRLKDDLCVRLLSGPGSSIAECDRKLAIPPVLRLALHAHRIVIVLCREDSAPHIARSVASELIPFMRRSETARVAYTHVGRMVGAAGLLNNSQHL